MQAVYIDTEFTQLSAERRLISLGLVAAGGAEFYVELSDTWEEADCSDFVREIVLPQLQPQRHGLPAAEAARAAHAFLTGLGEIEIVGDALAWDWPLLLELLAPSALPSGIVSREIRGLLAGLEESQIPHHALLDARLMAEQYALRG